MQITLLVPPVLEGTREVERVFGCTYGLYPIANIYVLTAASVLEQAGHKVRYIDAPVEGWSRADLERFLETDQSELYGFYTVNLAKRTDLLALGMIREKRGDVPVAFMGPSPTYEPEAYLVDRMSFVVRGEPELTLRELAEALQKRMGAGRADLSGIRGLSHLGTQGESVHAPPRDINRNLDALPHPARHLVDEKGYYNPKLGEQPVAAVLASRGCSYTCRYCVPNSLSFARELEYKRHHGGKKPPVAHRTPENILGELRHLKEQGYRSVAFLDDVFMWGESRTLALCEGIKQLGLKWGCLTRADHVTEKVAKALAESGCEYVDIGVESFNQAVLDDIKKDCNTETAVRAIKLLKKYRVPVKLNILVGSSPLETQETIRTDLEIIKALKPNAVMFGICNPFPGTEFWDVAKEKGWLIDDVYRPVDVQKEATIEYPHLRKEDLERAVRRANYSFYLNPGFLWRNLRKIKSPASVVKAGRSLLRKQSR
ncbi:MAG: radical SAM protein [Nitrospirae bacterium]|nr:radical SAM protein [Nitrospirota bacterium]